jgi:chitin synthase
MSQYASPTVETRVDPASMSQLALPAARTVPIIGRDPSPGSSAESGASVPPLRNLERGPSDDPSSFSQSSAPYSPYQPYSNESFIDEAEQPILPPHFPFRSSNSSPEPGFIQPGQYSSPVYAEPQHAVSPVQPPPRSRQAAAHGRGVSLVDTGPVPVGGQAVPHDPVRRVSRHARRSSSRNQLVSPVTASSHTSVLPPGAVSYEPPLALPAPC